MNSEEDYKRTCSLLKEHLKKNKDILTSSKGKDIVVFLGNTGAGKSTLINFLSGASLKVDNKHKDIVLKNPDEVNSLLIGRGGVSTTSLPQYVKVVHNSKETYMYDLPGFKDTRGVYTSIISAACIKEIIENASTARFVFVAKEGEIESSRGEGIKELAEIATSLFNNNSKIVKKSSILVLTKSDYSRSDELVEYVSEKLDIEARNTNGFNSWIRNNKIFPMGKGKLDKTQCKIIMDNIDKLTPANINKNDINIGAIYSDREKNQTGYFLDRILQDIEPTMYPDTEINKFNIIDITKIRTYLQNEREQKKILIDASPIPFLYPLISTTVYKDKMDRLDKRWNDAKTLIEAKLRVREVDIEKIEIEKQKIEQQCKISLLENKIGSMESKIDSLENNITTSNLNNMINSFSFMYDRIRKDFSKFTK